MCWTPVQGVFLSTNKQIFPRLDTFQKTVTEKFKKRLKNCFMALYVTQYMTDITFWQSAQSPVKNYAKQIYDTQNMILLFQEVKS